MHYVGDILVQPIAFESLGVRSMCTYIETPDVKILLDAGVSLGPNRYGLPPHPREYAALKIRREEIVRFAERSDVVTVSHYHFDHHTPSYTDWAYNWCSAEIAEKIYGGKIILAKNFRDHVNFSQRRRGWLFAKTSGVRASRLEIADEREFSFGETLVSFSKPVFHGPEESDLGWVIMVSVRYKSECIFFAPDVQGPMSEETLSIIVESRPQLAIIGGPPTYLADFRMKMEDIDAAINNLKVIVKHIPIVILDHHILRDENWKEVAKPIVSYASSVKHRVLTAADFLGEENQFLEALRKKLYSKEPPTSDFIRWTKTPSERRKLTPPPI
jgi:predicted metallo-beta-lactamase superfamily hydrolase